MKTLPIAVRALAYASVFLSVVGWLAFATRRFDSALGGPLPAWTPYLAIPPLAVGVPLGIACVAMFVVVGRGTAAPLDPPRQFVARGPYRYVRNPMYWGGLLTLMGLGLAARSPAMLAFAAVLAGVVQLLVILYEEPDLERRFGETYRDYKRQVARWLPRLPRA